MYSCREKNDRFIEYPCSCIRSRAFIRMHYWMVNVFLVLVGDLIVAGDRQQVHPSIFKGVHQPLSVEIDGLMPSILFLKLLTKAHDISVGKGISECEVCFLSRISSR